MQRRVDVVVKHANAPEGSVATPTRVELLLKGPRRHLDKLDSTTLTAVIDVEPEALAGERQFKKGFVLEPPLPERTEIVGEAPRVEVSLSGRRRRR